LYDTVRGATKDLASNTTTAETTQATGLTAFSGTGFSIGALAKLNTNAATYASWAFREQAKFFDIVTWTGNGTNRTIPHNLGSVPGCIIVKRTNSAATWTVYHRGLANTQFLALDLTLAAITDATVWNSTTPTSTEFSVGTSSNVNANTFTYVAYLFAHNAGGFGLSGNDNVISCDSFTTDGSGLATVTLGYEPQYVMVKRTSASSDWLIFDTMRGLTVTNDAFLRANTSEAEVSALNLIAPTATGFTIDFSVLGYTSASFIYIAIRRGPMKVPTSGTSVFSPVAYTGNATDTLQSAGFPVDMIAILRRSNPFGDGDGNPSIMDRLRGGNSRSLITSSSSAESTSTNNTLYLDNSVGFKTTANNPGAPTGYYFNVSTNPYIAECFRRAPGFFDVVCYTGTGSYPFTVNHNLGVVPELMIFKKRSAAENWWVYLQPLTAPNANWYQNYLIFTAAARASDLSSITSAPTSSVITLANFLAANNQTYVAYLFATAPGVSKVGSYTGTGTTQTINCGFTAGARFVLIKRTDSTGDWYIWDSARGIVAGNDPYLLINSTAAEVTNTDYVDTAATGFEISSTAPAAINANGGTFIFLAIA